MYSRKVGEKTLTFGHEGVLYRDSFVMYDKETDSLWIHTTGVSPKGALKGQRLRFLPSVVTTWGRWKKEYPATKVLTGEKARGIMGDFGLRRAIDRYGLSVGDGKRPKLFPYVILGSRTVVNADVFGTPIVVVIDPETLAGRAFERGEREFEWKDGAMRDARGAKWNPMTGAPEGGGERPLVPVPATPWLIQKWRGFYPNGEVYGAD